MESTPNKENAVAPIQSPLVFKAINAVQAELAKQGITKDRKTDSGARFNFRGIDDIYNALSPLLAKHGLVIMPRFENRQVVERQTKNGGTLFYITVIGHFDFISATDGSSHSVTTFGEAMDSGDKGTNKAMSIAYKYACMQVFAIPTEGDNDPDAHNHPPLQHQGQMQQPQMQPQSNSAPQNFPMLPAPTNEAVKSGDDGKLYDAQDRRIFTPEQFNQLIMAITTGKFNKNVFMNDNKYRYSLEQYHALQAA